MGMSSGEMQSKKAAQQETFDPNRAARHARKLQKASSQGAAPHPPTPTN